MAGLADIPPHASGNGQLVGLCQPWASGQSRAANTVQVVGRQAEGAKQLEQLFNVEIALPRDNSVKDFLNSADEKFSGFKSQGECMREGSYRMDKFPMALE